jgi:glutathione S-transferase
MLRASIKYVPTKQECAFFSEGTKFGRIRSETPKSFVQTERGSEMEPVLFYGIPHGCSFGSIVAFEWLGEPYRLCRIAMPIEPDDETYRRVNPTGETPAMLSENGTALTESLAILHWVAARASGKKKWAFRQGTAEFDRFNQVLSFLVSSFHPIWWPVFQPARYADDEAAREVVRAKALEILAKRYQHVEGLLAGREWLVGDSPGLADAYLYGTARWGDGLFDIAGDYPRLFALQQRLAADGAVRFAQAIEDATPAVTTGKFLGHVSLDEVRGCLAA